MKRTTFERFDVVAIRTTKNVTWMIDLPGSVPKVEGLWKIVCCFPNTGDILISKDTAMCRIPVSDIVKVANYELGHVFDKLENTHGVRQIKREEGTGKGRESGAGRKA